MDCRTSLLLTLALALPCAGCITPSPRKTPAAPANPPPAPTQQTAAAAPAPVPPPAAPAPPHEKVVPKKNPKASTCVAGARLQMSEASNPKLTPVQREELYDSALKGFQQALSIDPTCGDAYLGLGRLYMMMGVQDKAMDAFQEGARKQPKNAELWFQLGVCYARRKDWSPAIQALRKAHEAEPDNRSCTNTLGLCLAVNGRADEALALLTSSVGPAQGHFWMGRLCLYMHQVDRAKEHLRLALQVDPKLAAAQELLVRLEAPPAPAAAAANAPNGRTGADLGFEGLQ